MAKDKSIPIDQNPKESARASSSESAESVRWKNLNPWLTHGQADDRPVMDGSVKTSDQTLPGQRSSARASHQLAFKRWSQTRHD